MRRFTFAITLLVATLIAPSVTFAGQAAKTGGAAAKVRATAASPVNLNSASVAQLQTLPGIGASAAQRIVDYRQKNGSFKKIEELMNVKGIGEKSFLKLKPLITVASDKADRPSGQK
jgi:comEA protein